MEKDKIFDKDLLREFINPERIEKAPEGFTAKTMTRIQIESGSVESRSFLRRNPVPVVFCLITLVLILLAVFIPASQNDNALTSFSEFFKIFEIPIPQINLPVPPRINIPGWTMYSMIGLLFVIFFDRVLYGIFHRESK